MYITRRLNLFNENVNKNYVNISTVKMHVVFENVISLINPGGIAQFNENQKEKKYNTIQRAISHCTIGHFPRIFPIGIRILKSDNC